MQKTFFNPLQGAFPKLASRTFSVLLILIPCSLLRRVFDLAMTTCLFCRRGSLRIIAAITHESVITRILRHCKLVSVPPPIAPARCRQELFAFDEAQRVVS
jgi:hypothetical protein